MPAKKPFQRHRSLALALTVVVAFVALGGLLTRSAEGGDVLRVGYFPNLTHGQALIGFQTGQLQAAVGPTPRLLPTVFAAGPELMEALFAGRIDVAYVGPGPTITGFVHSGGSALRVVAGAASGGALFVVRDASGIDGPEDLAGRRVASPQIGNTQDIALRHFLHDHGLRTKDEGGDVQVLSLSGADTLTLFRKGHLDAAWVAEPWASRLVAEAGGRILLDERDLWPGGGFVSANVVVRAGLLRERPELVDAFLGGHVDLTRWAADHPAEAAGLMNARLAELTGKPLPEPVLVQALTHLNLTWDPHADSLHRYADRSFDLGFLGEERPDLRELHDLAPLQRVLAARGLPPLATPDLTVMP